MVTSSIHRPFRVAQVGEGGREGGHRDAHTLHRQGLKNRGGVAHSTCLADG